jgi:hypothetical protein
MTSTSEEPAAQAQPHQVTIEFLALVIVSAIHRPAPLQGALFGLTCPGVKNPRLYAFAAPRHSLADTMIKAEFFNVNGGGRRTAPPPSRSPSPARRCGCIALCIERYQISIKI